MFLDTVHATTCGDVSIQDKSASSSLPTPPSTSRRDKENLPLRRRRTVEWSDSEQVHWISREGSRDDFTSQAAISLNRQPLRSILKPPRALPLASWFDDEKKRDTTPQPEDALANSDYLVWPVSQIVSSTEEATASPLKDLIEAYSILAARLRASVCSTPALTKIARQTSLPPLLQPLRTNANGICNAIVRDLSLVLLDPLSTTVGTGLDRQVTGLPSPEGSPKRRGLSEDEVKNARDVCVLCHSAIKLLHVLFVMPMLFNIFEVTHLQNIFEQLLAIPLAQSLPTPNARKTYALAIGLIQAQRLPIEVLAPFTDDIVTAIRRGIEGNLGKEGKKGAGGDGLKAINELCVNFPTTFCPAFADILPAIFENLVSPAPAMRSSAANALGGFVFGLASIYLTLDMSLVERLSQETLAFLIGSPSESSTPPRAPGTMYRPNDSQIHKFLRATLKNLEPTCPTQGPVWGISVVSSLIILLGPAVVQDAHAFKIIESLLLTGVKHKKSAVRILASMPWRPLIWVWSKWRDVDQTSTGPLSDEQVAARDALAPSVHKLMRATLDCKIGISIVGGRLGPTPEHTSPEDLKVALDILRLMANSGGTTAASGIHLLNHLISGAFGNSWAGSRKTSASEGEQSDFDAKLIPKGLFCIFPGLLTAEWTALTGPVKRLLESCPDIKDVRPLSLDELAKEEVWDLLMYTWQDSITSLELNSHEPTPPPIIDGWSSLVMARAKFIKDSEEAIAFAKRCADILISLLNNAEVNFGNTTATPVVKVTPAPQSAGSIKFSVIRELWRIVPRVFSDPAAIKKVVNRFLAFLIRHERRLVPSDNPESQTRCDWAQLCADVCSWGAVHLSSYFWRGCESWDWKWTLEQRSVVWRCYAKAWREGEGSWEGACIVLGFPFDDEHPWDMCDVDLTEWNTLLQYALSRASFDEVSSTAALESVSINIKRTHLTSMTCSVQVADLLLAQLDLSTHDEHSTEFPDNLLDLIREVMEASYPPEAASKVVCCWLIRSMCSVIDGCPSALLPRLLGTVYDGLCSFMIDESGRFSTEEYIQTLVPLYQTVLVNIQALPPTRDIVQSFSYLLTSALRGRSTEGREALETFKEFWQSNCTSLVPPRDGWAENLTAALELFIARAPTTESALPSECEVEELISQDDDGYDGDVSFNIDTSELDRSANESPLVFPSDDEHDRQVASEVPASCQVLDPLSQGVTAMRMDESAKVDEDARRTTTDSEKDKIEQEPDSSHDAKTKLTPSTCLSTPRHSKPSSCMPRRPGRSSTSASATRSDIRSCPSSPLGEVSSRRINKNKKCHRTPFSSPSGPTHKSEKENAAPVNSTPLGSPSRSNTHTPLMVLGKRSVNELSPLSSKRRKISESESVDIASIQPFSLYRDNISCSPSAVDVNDEKMVEASLPLCCSSSLSSSSDAPAPPDKAAVVDHGVKVELLESPLTSAESTPTRKRKGTFMDSVVVPTLNEVLTSQGISPRSMRLETSAHHDTNTITSSGSRSSGSCNANKRGKRRRTSHLPPVKIKQEVEGLISLLNSDDRLSSDDPPAPAAPSSDDSISTFGRLSPCHLITPPLRRSTRKLVAKQEADLSSDDSFSSSSSSPIRSHVARRARRTMPYPGRTHRSATISPVKVESL